MRVCAAVLASVAVLATAAPVTAQERFRISVNVGQQATSTSVTEEQTFQQYFEQGSFTFERTIPKALFYDAGGVVQLWRGLHAGAAVSIFNNTGAGDMSVRVPHPLFFNQPRTAAGQVADVRRREVGQHVSVGWLIPAAAGIDFMVFGGPSVFTTEQVVVRTLTLSLDKEIYPFNSLAFPSVVAEKLRDNVVGYNAGVDLTWRFAGHLGAGLLVRYAHGKKAFTPTGGTPVELEVGGLHAGGGLRVTF